jgi:glycosyltransferase involved in cell wall biosynthesis
MHRYKLAILVSHPIQYQAPLFKKLAKETDLTVYFCWDFGVGKESFDTEFGKKIKWDIPLLEGYNYKFLKNYSLKPSSEFWGQINFGIIKELISGTSDVRNINGNFGASDVQKSKYDAVIIFGWNSFTNWLAFITAFISKMPVLLRAENPLNQEFLKSKWKLKIKKIILGWLFRRVGAFLYIGEENKKFYRYYGVPDKKLFFTSYAVDNSRFIKEARNLKFQISNLKNSIGIDVNNVVILFVGKLIDKKRPMDLLKAYELLVNKLISYSGNRNNSITNNLITKTALLFIGDGALRPELEKYVKEHNLKNVHFAGFKNQTELPQYYAMADIFVLPSGEGETWGLVVNEAMCFGLSVIVSDLVGCGPDLVRQGENGYIFPLGNIEKLAEYLGELVKKPARIKSFGKKSFKIIQDYSYEKDIKGISTALKFINLSSCDDDN